MDVKVDTVTVIADEQRTVQVLVNLLGNALKFSPEHSSIEIASQQRHEMIKVRVTDHGKGFAGSSREDLQSVPASTKKRCRIPGRRRFGIGYLKRYRARSRRNHRCNEPARSGLDILVYGQESAWVRRVILPALVSNLPCQWNLINCDELSEVNAVTETKCIFDTVRTGELPAGCTLETLSREPRVYVVRDFLSDEECDQIIALAGDGMQQSITVDMETGEAVTAHHRTSTSKWLKRGVAPVVAAVEDRIARLISLPAGHGADINLLHYRIGQEYGAHDDVFDPDVPGLQTTLAQAGQRLLTILLYLADVESGGETIFPKVNFAFKPQKRAALLFYNVLPDGKIDRLSHHGSAPVRKGEKWVATKWIMERNLDDR